MWESAAGAVGGLWTKANSASLAWKREASSFFIRIQAAWESAVVAIESEGTAHSQWQEQDISRMGCSQRCYISAVRTNPYIRKDASDFSCIWISNFWIKAWFRKNRKNSRYRSSRYQNDSWAALGEVKKRQIFEKEERYPSQEEKFSRYLWWTDVA